MRPAAGLNKVSLLAGKVSLEKLKAWGGIAVRPSFVEA
jgi:hypothetical protein